MPRRGPRFGHCFPPWWSTEKGKSFFLNTRIPAEFAFPLCPASYHFYVKGGLICLIAGLVSFVPEIRSFVPELGRRHIYVIKHHLPSYGKVSYTFIRFLHRASFYVINNHGRIRASLKIIDHAGRIHISYSIMCHKLHMTS